MKQKKSNNKTLEKREFKERLVAEKEDHFQIFLLVACALLVIEILLGERKKMKKA